MAGSDEPAAHGIGGRHDAGERDPAAGGACDHTARGTADSTARGTTDRAARRE
jgi:hypothetical protein